MPPPPSPLSPKNDFPPVCASRRGLLKAAVVGLGAVGVLSCALPWPAFAAGRGTNADPYALHFVNTHTGERFQGVYRVGDRYIPQSLERINHFLRDFRTGDVHPIDPRVLDIVYVAHRMTGEQKPFHIISGYRSPRTNTLLRHTGGGGVARNSLHMHGQAIDLRMEGFSTSALRTIGRHIQAGGVGYYPKSDFVHLDCGPFRTW